MNTLFILRCPIGDSIIFSCFLKDYKDQFPEEKLYILPVIPSIIDIFKNSSIVNIYEEHIKYNKIFDYDLNKFDTSKNLSKNDILKSGKMKLQDTPYFYFDKIFNTNVLHNTHIPFIELDDYQKQQIQSNKPICLINPVANYYMFDCRYFGKQRYQQIINDFKDKINFVTIGNCLPQMLNKVTLQNVYLDLINKTSLYQLLKWIYNSNIIITHESGIYHLANIISDTNRDLIALFGARYTKEINSYDTPNINTHYIFSDNSDYYKENCFNCNQKICTNELLLSEINGMTFGNKICKRPILLNGEFLSHCMGHISIEQVENCLNNILNNQN